MFANDQFLSNFANAEGNLAIAIDPSGTLVRDQIGARVLGAHPTAIVDYLQYLWDSAAIPGEPPFPEYALSTTTSFNLTVNALKSAAPTIQNRWMHLIYAYLIENTRIYDIMRKVLDAYTQGESLGVATPPTLRWLKTTEALFYRQQTVHDHFTPTTLTSDARDVGSGIRRNAYYRMFGMELNHDTEHKYTKPEVANREFVSTLEDLLRELWIAFTHPTTILVGNPTDNGAIEDLTRRLFIMLRNRRLNETLRVEEFSAVATLDWLRLSVSFDSAIVVDLRAEATSEAERLHKIAERVGMPAHTKSQDYFELAAPMSLLLQGIEAQIFTDRVSLLNGLGPQLSTILTNWSSATGRNLKTREPERKSAAA